MKKLLLATLILLNFGFGFSQNNPFWEKKSSTTNAKIKSSKKDITNPDIYSLNLGELKSVIALAPARKSSSKKSNVIIPFPNSLGEFENFRIQEASVMHPDLQVEYPNIRSYVGQGVNDPSEIIRFSVSPLGLHSMSLSSTKRATFIEPYTEDLSYYRVYDRSKRPKLADDFECEVTHQLNKTLSNGKKQAAYRNADDGILRTYRLVVSATGEYTQYHGGTKALALAAINTTMTRVNGIYERDFNVTLELIANTDDVIYTNTSTDPYGNTTSGYNSALQNTLTSIIGEANYDIGHLFANLQNNGNAGCIGCVCVNNQKGSGWTSHTVPEGDPFDVDYVAHEMGHQFGGNHTWTHAGNEGRNVQMEPGSGSTIMGYAGITGATDVQVNSDPYFHAISIQQITDYIKTTGCQTDTNTGNTVPNVNAGNNYTIPRGTPFVLEGSATDADTGDVLSYCWEQMDENNASTTYPSVNATTGVAFRSFNPTTDSKRYFPRLETIKTGATSWQWEAVPNVARNLNFRLTVRDNQAGGGTNNSDDMVVSVNGTAGPFILNSPNTGVIWNVGTTQTVTWDVAGTTGNGINAANVDIFLSIDGGDTYPIALASGVANDGSQDIVVPDHVGTQNRVMVKASNNIFFDISNTDFSIEGQVVCNATTPTGLAASNINSDTATLSWDAVPGASYDLEYREIGAGSWTTLSVNGISQALSGLTPLTQYEAQVRSKCPDTSTSPFSSTINFTTTDVQLNYCSSASTNVNDEYISRVQLNTIDNTSGGQFYSDFTGISTILEKGTQYAITVTPTWTGTVYNEAYSVWIDYNRDGDFDDAGEQVFTQAPTQSSPVSGNFTVPSSAVENSTRMRVSMQYNSVPTACETFQYGEVEDYTVMIEAAGPDTTPPVITLNGASSVDIVQGGTYTEEGATALDNVDGDISANITIGGQSVDTSTLGTYIVTYNVSDAAGNAATEITRTVNVIEALPGCSGGINTFPYAFGFEGSIGNWSQSTADDLDWLVNSGSTPSNNTGPSGASEGSDYIYVEASGNNTGYPNKRAIITSPCFDLSAASEATFSFQYHMYGDPDMGTLDLEISNDNGATWTSLWNQSGEHGTAWLFVNINLTSYAGGSVQLRFNRFVGGTWRADIAIDDINLTTVEEDTIAPVITLNGSSSIDINLGETYTELGATATDNIDGDISADIVIGGDNVDTNTPGTYLITYNVSDAAGNPATEVIRTVNVIPDTTAPVITLNGASTINLNVGESYTELGATATDNVDGDISANIVIGGDAVNTNNAGTYIVTYNVSDAAGNPADEVNRTVNVIPDTTAPVITLNGASTINLNVGESYTELGATATDNVDGDISANIVIGGDTIDTNTPGTYLVTYNVSDAAGNAANEMVRTVNVIADTTAPVITLNGASTINLYVAELYNELGATATDNIDGDISANIVIGGDTVDTNTPGTYLVTYNVSDAAGNVANEVVRTVDVIADTTAPIITLNGASTINLYVGELYNELGATATDNIDGDISANMVIGGDTVDTNTAGTYTVTYNVSDAAGNSAVESIRTVNVLESVVGCTGGISSFPYSESFENTLGAWTQSSADDIDWTVDANGTPSSNTGPGSASTGSYYVYVEASSPNYPSRRAILNSPCFDLSSLPTANFSFDIHMYGSSDMGTIELELSDDDGATWTSIWSQSGNQGNSWSKVNIDLSQYTGGGVQLRFNRFVGGTWQADIAIDNVVLSENPIVIPGCSGGISSFPYNQSFENTLGAWSQSVADDIDWTVDANGTPSNNTGPNAASAGSYYIYVEASGNGTGYPNKRAIINSPCFDLSGLSSANFSFDYHMYGASDMGTLNLEISNDNGSSWTSIWSQSGNQGNSWLTVNVDLSTYVGGGIQLRFNRFVGSTWQADVAIDNVNLTATSASSSRATDRISSDTNNDSNIHGLTIYPNPVKGDILNVKIGADKFSYKIINSLGQLISKGDSTGEINVDRLEAGMYFIEVKDGEETMNKRFIKE